MQSYQPRYLLGFIKLLAILSAQVHFRYKLKSSVMEYRQISSNNCLSVSGRRKTELMNLLMIYVFTLDIQPFFLSIYGQN